ncbi:hypothetical protein D0U04_07275 [Bacillus clarus]|uniref:Uncharacterized protein n=1 Tax=Bacillus clarus TaxID=2338372 RepID=A0A090YU17_9BACI|nr:hypothetical protein [Bacillus clarus]KFN02369.1 hypothetical protein DJ93_4791 [Bacillus clarus]RFT67571.1 hypothetical protein D0U04_07275 [Bacillus clarus]
MNQFELERITYLGGRKEEVDFRTANVSIDNYLDWKITINGTTDQYEVFIEIMKRNEQPVFELLTASGEVFQGRTKIIKMIPDILHTEIELFGIGKLNGYKIKSVQ